MGPRKIAIAAAALVVLTPLAWSTETIRYTYDAQGRLITAVSTGPTAGPPSTSNYKFDPAQNRYVESVALINTQTPPSLAIGSAAAVNPGGTLSFAVSRTNGLTATSTVIYATGGGNAIAGTDYTNTSGSLTFNPGDNAKTISVATNAASSGSVTLNVMLSSPSAGTTISTATASGSINAGAPQIVATGAGGVWYIPPQSQTQAFSIAQLATLNGRPAIVTAFSPPAGSGTGVIYTGGQSVGFAPAYIAQPAPCTSDLAKTVTIPYTVQDTSNGHTVTGYVTADLIVAQLVGKNPCP